MKPVGAVVMLMQTAGVHLGGDSQPGFYISIDVCPDTITFVIRPDSDGFLIQHISGNKIFHFGVSAGDA